MVVKVYVSINAFRLEIRLIRITCVHAHMAVQEAADELQWVEFFAGNAEATKHMKLMGYTAAKLDVTFMQGVEGKPNSNPMDLCTDSGMAKPS